MAIAVTCPGCKRQFRAKDQIKDKRIKCPACKSDVDVVGPHVCGSDVFISHSSQDKQVADAVCAAMESKNLACWIAPRDIPAGASWGSAIIEGIEDSRAMLLVFSEHANKSDQVLREVERAVAKKVPIIPLRIDRCEMRKDYEYFLASCHWLDATDGPLEAHLAGLTRRVKHMLLDRAEEDADQKTSPVPSVPAAIAASRSARRAILFVAAALLVVLVGVAGFIAKRSGNDAVSSDAPASQPATKVAATARPIDLLAGVQLPQDTVGDSHWKRVGNEISVDGPMPGKLRFAAPPAGDYDFHVSFTPIQGDQGFGLVATRFGKSFLFGYRLQHFGFEKFGKASRERMVPSGKQVVANGGKVDLMVKVRSKHVIAYVDGVFVGELFTGYGDLETPPLWAVGRNVLGFVTYRDVTIHAAECTPVEEN